MTPSRSAAKGGDGAITPWVLACLALNVVGGVAVSMLTIRVGRQVDVQSLIFLRMMIGVTGRDVLLVDDIFDTGKTLDRLASEVSGMGAASVRTAVLLKKVRPVEVSIRPDFAAFEIPDEFVVGYGLDYRDHFRNLPYLAVVESHDLEGL